MQLLLVRHGIAVESTEFAVAGQPDDLRPLTDEGAAKMSEAAKGLKWLVPELQVIASSTLVRAQQTADLIHLEYRESERTVLPALAPEGSAEEVINWLFKFKPGDCIALVGHEPSISVLACQLLAGTSRLFHRFKKGGACLIEFYREPRVGAGELVWAMVPRALRRIGGR